VCAEYREVEDVISDFAIAGWGRSDADHWMIPNGMLARLNGELVGIGNQLEKAMLEMKK
jgi:hypothetical protein